MFIFNKTQGSQKNIRHNKRPLVCIQCTCTSIPLLSLRFYGPTSGSFYGSLYGEASGYRRYGEDGIALYFLDYFDIYERKSDPGFIDGLPLK